MSFPFSTRAPFRLLAPAGGFASPSAIFNAWIAVRQTLKESNHKESTIAEFLWVLEDCLRRYFGVREVLCVGSGKEALWFFYNMLARSDSRGVIAMSAYTCPDIAAAAIRSGHKVLAVDVDPKTLEPMFESISESYEKSISSLVLSNLYGLVDTLPSELVTTRLSPSAIVDDACQAALSDTPHGKVGARTGCYGVVSFGRGKALGGVGGGALLLPQTQFAKELKEEFALDLTGDSIRYTIVDVLKASLYWLFEKPWLYPLPASVPWLKLGVTECNVFFKTRPISKTQVSTIVAQVKEDTMRRRQTISVATAWAEALSGTSIIQPYVERQTSKEGQVVPLRYPVLLGSEEGRNKAFKKLLGKGLGVSCSYPGTLQTYQDLKSELLPTECPNAEKVSKTILTLPTHKYVTASDIKAAAKILASID